MVSPNGLEIPGNGESLPATALQLAVGCSHSTSLVLSSIFSIVSFPAATCRGLGEQCCKNIELLREM